MSKMMSNIGIISEITMLQLIMLLCNFQNDLSVGFFHFRRKNYFQSID